MALPGDGGDLYSRPSIREQRLSLLICAILLIIAGGILLAQRRYDPALWRLQPAAVQQEQAAATPGAPSADLISAAGEGLLPLSPPERFDSATLADKIDGKADLYLSAGFRSLETQRFALVSDSGRWLECFVYDMGAPRNAYAVLSQQRRAEAQPLALAAEAYQAANGVFLAQGSYYVEIIASEQSEPLQAATTALARAFVQQHPVLASAPDERSLFPAEHQVASSVTLTAKDAFGCERLDQMFTAQYRWDSQEATAFVSRRASAAEADELAGVYVAFLQQYGGRPLQGAQVPPQMQVLSVFDTFEVVFSQGVFLAGVHEAGDLGAAIRLAEALQRNIKESSYGP